MCENLIHDYVINRYLLVLMLLYCFHFFFALGLQALFTISDLYFFEVIFKCLFTELNATNGKL